MYKWFYLLWLILVLTVMGCQTSKPIAQDYLTADNYSKILIEVIPVTPKLHPSAEALNFLCQKIKKYCHKDKVSWIIKPPIIQSEGQLPFPAYITGYWTNIDVLDLDYYGAVNKNSDTLTLRAYYLNGKALDRPSLLGRAYGSRMFTIFIENMEDKIESRVLLHEMGHILGLVERKHHADYEHPSHCTSICIMVWYIDTGSPFDFDIHCERELKANGGR